MSKLKKKFPFEMAKEFSEKGENIKKICVGALTVASNQFLSKQSMRA